MCTPDDTFDYLLSLGSGGAALRKIRPFMTYFPPVSEQSLLKKRVTFGSVSLPTSPRGVGAPTGSFRTTAGTPTSRGNMNRPRTEGRETSSPSIPQYLEKIARCSVFDGNSSVGGPGKSGFCR